MPIYLAWAWFTHQLVDRHRQRPLAHVEHHTRPAVVALERHALLDGGVGLDVHIVAHLHHPQVPAAAPHASSQPSMPPPPIRVQRGAESHRQPRPIMPCPTDSPCTGSCRCPGGSHHGCQRPWRTCSGSWPCNHESAASFLPGLRSTPDTRSNSKISPEMPRCTRWRRDGGGGGW